jgi:hypothetical protein
MTDESTARTKIVHRTSESAQQRPEDGLLLGVLKSLEQELHRRRRLQTLAHNGQCSPLWFIAETERNVFLWRRGYSLHDEANFEFWVRPEQLVEKHLRLMNRQDGLNPFINPMWGMTETTSGDLQPQIDYLDELLDQLSMVAAHASALSHASTRVLMELRGESEQHCSREVVIIPSSCVPATPSPQ